MTDTPAPLSIDVISDVVCPWCFVGKRQLEQALSLWADEHPDAPAPEVRWHPFQLNPDLPAEGIDRADYLKMKFGDRAGGNMYDNVRRAATDVGLDLSMDDIERQPNTIRAHSLIALAQQHNQQKMVETLFEAYFQKGVDLTSEQSLIETAREAGLAEPLIEAALNDESVHETVRAADANARQLGVSGVPFFIFNQRLAVSGAAGAETLVQAFRKASEPADESAANDA